MKTSEDLITEVTPIPHGTIENAKKDNILQVHEESLAKFRVEQGERISVGRQAYLTVTGPMHKTRRLLEDQISEKCEKTQVVIEANKQSGDLALFTVPEFKSTALHHLNEFISQATSQLLNEHLEHPISNTEGSMSATRVLLGPGCSVVTLLLPAQTRSMIIQQKSKTQINIDEKELLKVFSAFGPVDKLQKAFQKKLCLPFGGLLHLSTLRMQLALVRV